jgi:glutamyl-tRNA synthetase
MKEWVASKKVEGWDDARLPTVRALLRRGFQPEAFEKFAVTCGMSKTDIRVGWENLEGINRKIIDSLSNRYMAVIDPVRISVKGGPETDGVYESMHPDFPARGKRKMPADWSRIYVSGSDWKSLKGKKIRLKGLGNIKLDKASRYDGNDIIQKMPKIQWVSEPNFPVELMTPDGMKPGIGEINLKEVKAGMLIQLERIGFVKVDSVKPDRVILFYAHK